MSNKRDRERQRKREAKQASDERRKEREQRQRQALTMPLRCAALLCVLFSATASGSTAVTILDESNFDSVVGQSQGVFVEVFRPLVRSL